MIRSRKERNEWIAFTVSKEEKEIIVGKARNEDQSISDFCRKTLIGSDSFPVAKREVDKLQISMFSER